MAHIYNQNMFIKSIRTVIGLCLMAVITLLSTSINAQDLYFSEYIEGSGQNKAFEIYNPTDADIDLGNYIVLGNFNGNPFNDTLRFEAGTMLMAGDVYVVAHEDADVAITAEADSLIENPFASGTSFIAVFNGDDVRGLFKISGMDTTLIDIIGVPEVDPGDGWDVAGVTEATKDHTLLRKSSIVSGNTDWIASAGTSISDSEWYVFDQNDFSNIGKPTDSATVDVTFTVNMSAVNDTISSNYEVSVNGYFKSNGDQKFASGETTDWGSSATAQLTNIGGDYWQGTFKMVLGDTLHYKYRYNLEGISGRDEAGLEQGVNPDGNDLRYVIANANTMLDVEYFNIEGGNPSIADTNPFMMEDAVDDTVGVLFRVNMGAQVQNGTFDPATDSVEVRGSVLPLTFGGDTGAKLAKEDAENGDNIFYSGVVYFHRDSLAEGTETDGSQNLIPGSFRYKFYANIDGGGTISWEDGSDRVVVISPTTPDTTLGMKFFSRTRPSAIAPIETTLNFEVNVGILEGLGLFNTSIDTMIVTGGFDSWGKTKKMDFSSLTGTYSTSFPFTAVEGSETSYKFFVKWSALRDDSESEFFLEGITADQSGWEEPGITGGGDRKFVVENVPSQPTLSKFYNDVSPEARLTENNVDGGAITVTFSIDMTPATDLENNPFVPASDSVFLFVDTPFFALTNDIIVPGDQGQNFIKNTPAQMEKLRFTDEDGDMVYTLDLDLILPTLNNIGFRVAYGEPTAPDGGLHFHSVTTEPGRRYYQYIQPMVDENLNVTWPSTFAFPQLTWVFSDLPFEQPPSYTDVSNEEELGTVETFSLEQNYPNPFNPTTNIRFNLPNAADVTLTVYNVLGQKVATLLNNKKFTVGSHSVAFDARNLASGVYIYRIEAGTFSQSKKMMLIK